MPYDGFWCEAVSSGLCCPLAGRWQSSAGLSDLAAEEGKTRACALLQGFQPSGQPEKRQVIQMCDGNTAAALGRKYHVQDVLGA